MALPSPRLLKGTEPTLNLLKMQRKGDLVKQVKAAIMNAVEGNLQDKVMPMMKHAEIRQLPRGAEWSGYPRRGPWTRRAAELSGNMQLSTMRRCRPAPAAAVLAATVVLQRVTLKEQRC